jgi:hypothetical protein
VDTPPLETSLRGSDYEVSSVITKQYFDILHGMEKLLIFKQATSCVAVARMHSVCNSLSAFIAICSVTFYGNYLYIIFSAYYRALHMLKTSTDLFFNNWIPS